MKRFTLPAAWLLSFLLPFSASAQQDRTVPLDTLVVIGAAYHPAATVSRISVEEIERQRAGVAYDVLQHEPGLHLVERMGLTGTGLARLAIRGAGTEGPAGLATFIDGRPDPSVSFAHPIPQAHSIGDIREVAVIHGPSPVLHGAGNTGAIMIRTPDADPGFTGKLTASGGSFGTIENFASASYGADRGFAQGHVTYRRTDGYLPNGDAWILGGNLQMGYELAQNWRIRLAAGQTRDHFGVFGPFSVPGPFGNPGTTQLDLTQTTADAKLDGRLGRVNTSLQLWGQTLDPRSQVLPPGAERADVSDIGSRLRASISPSPSSRITVGMDVLHSSARNTPAIPPSSPEIDVSLTEVGPYVFYEQALFPQLSLSGGVRVTQHSEYGTEPSGEVGFLFQPGVARPGNPLQGTQLRTRVTRGFQSPTLQQLFGVFRGGTAGPPNPDLDSERVTQIEGGIDQRFRRLAFSLTAFLQEGSNIIVPVAGELKNTGDFSHYGLEASATLQLLEGLSLDGGLTTLNLSENVLRVPRTAVDFGLLFEPPALSNREASFHLYGRYAYELYDRPLDSDEPRVRLDDYLVANVKLRAQVWEELFGFLEVQNITDTEYENVLGIPMPPRSIFAGATIRW